ncbi:MAG: site-2 protease family protein [Clostridium fessum]
MLAALIVFSLIVLFHEFGHFLLAKRGGICVVEFSLGMGPRLFQFCERRDAVLAEAASVWRFLYDAGGR